MLMKLPEQPDQELPMASITKVMTAIVALDSGVNLMNPLRDCCSILKKLSAVVGLTSDDIHTQTKSYYDDVWQTMRLITLPSTYLALQQALLIK